MTLRNRYHEKKREPVTSDELILACLSLNLTLTDIRGLRISTLFSFLRTKVKINEQKSKEEKEQQVRQATQEDIDKLARL